MRPRRTAAEDDFAIQCLGHDIAYHQFDYIISPSHLYRCIFYTQNQKKEDYMATKKNTAIKYGDKEYNYFRIVSAQ